MQEQRASGTSAAPSPRRPGEPYCANCGYSFLNLTGAANCPECGRPIAEVLIREKSSLPRGKRYTSQSTLFGWPVIDIALGPAPEKGEATGKARGIIAIGDQARGGIAIGGFSVGIVALGGASIGVCAVGGGAIGVLTAFGGGAVAVGGLALGGGAVGGIASGGGAAGFIAEGGTAIGYYARGPGVFGKYVINPATGRSDPEAVQMFQTLAPITGGPKGYIAIRGLAAAVCINLIVALLIVAAVALFSKKPAR